MYNVTKLPTDQFGMLYRPSLNTMNPLYDNADYLYGTKNVPQEFSDRNHQVLLESFLSVRDHCPAILEIGVCRNGEKSSTHVFLENKLPDTVYLGVDIEDKSFLDNYDENIFTLKTDSANFDTVVGYLKSLDVDQIGYLLIDGWHSTNASFRDQRYCELLMPGGCLFMHDTSIHPCLCVWDGLDPDIFDKTKLFAELNDDYGCGIARLKPGKSFGEINKVADHEDTDSE
jgi:hypothetical protein